MTKRAMIQGVMGMMTLALSGAACSGSIEVEDEANIEEVSEALTSAVYTDQLASGWQNWSWRTTVNSQATSPVQSGTKSLSATYGINWAGLYLHSSTLLTGSNYDTLHFFIHGGTAGGQQISVVLRDGSDAEGTTVNLAAPVAGQWTEVNIPLTSLGSLPQISAIIFQSNTSTAQPTFYLDGISFTSAAPPPPPPPPPPPVSTPAAPPPGPAVPSEAPPNLTVPGTVLPFAPLGSPRVAPEAPSASPPVGTSAPPETPPAGAVPQASNEPQN